MPPIEEFFTISWAKDPVRVERGRRAAATLRAKLQARKGARGTATLKGAAKPATAASARAAAAAARAKARAQAAASRQRRVQAAKRRIARAQVRQADRGVRTAGRATQRAARVLAKARAALATAKAAVARATQAHRGAVRAEARAARHRAKVARKVPTAAVKPVAAPASGFGGFGSWRSRPAAAPASTAASSGSPAVLGRSFCGFGAVTTKPISAPVVEPPLWLNDFSFGRALGRRLAFDRAWLASSSVGMGGKCEISGTHGDSVSCTECVPPSGGTFTIRTATPLAVFSPTGGIQARRSVCRFIIDASDGPMRYTCVGLLPGTAQARPRARAQDLGGWMLNVLFGTLSSSVDVSVSGPRPVLRQGGAVEMVFDYDSQKCFIAAYTPDAVVAGYSQPPQSVTELEFAGRAFPADGALYPAVRLFMDGVTVHVEEPSPGAAIGQPAFGSAFPAVDHDLADHGEGDIMAPRDGFDDDEAFYEGSPMAQDAPPAK
jgi:hypothetical protein